MLKGNLRVSLVWEGNNLFTAITRDVRKFFLKRDGWETKEMSKSNLMTDTNNSN